MKNSKKTKAILRMAGIVAVIALIAFSMASCAGLAEAMVAGAAMTADPAWGDSTWAEAESAPTFPETIKFRLGHNIMNDAAAKKAVFFWFNGDRTKSLTVRPADGLREWTIRTQPGQETVRIDAEFADGSGGQAFIEFTPSSFVGADMDFLHYYYLSYGGRVEITATGN